MTAAEWHAERYRVLSTTSGDVDGPDPDEYSCGTGCWCSTCRGGAA